MCVCELIFFSFSRISTFRFIILLIASKYNNKIIVNVSVAVPNWDKRRIRCVVHCIMIYKFIVKYRWPFDTFCVLSLSISIACFCYFSQPIYCIEWTMFVVFYSHRKKLLFLIFKWPRWRHVFYPSERNNRVLLQLFYSFYDAIHVFMISRNENGEFWATTHEKWDFMLTPKCHSCPLQIHCLT